MAFRLGAQNNGFSLMMYVDDNELNTFEPRAIDAMVKAYTEACILLQVFAGDERGKQAVATRVIDLARTGVIDAIALRDRVLLEAGIAA
jgi:hypothetical protein